MAEEYYAPVATDLIRSSPYQPRRSFSGIQSLAGNIRDHGLIHPILLRPIGDYFELVSGERRLRAVRDILRWENITAVVRPLSDLQAQIVCLSENLQRDDLTKIEEIESIARWIDARMREDERYLPWLQRMYSDRKGGPRLKLDLADPIDRTAFFLALCESDRKNGTEKVSGNIVANLDSAIADLNRNVDWISYASHDLPLIRDLPEIIWKAATEEKLNKAQVKALKDAYVANPTEVKKVLKEGKAEIFNKDTGGIEEVPLRELSAREISASTQNKQGSASLVVQSLSNEWYTPEKYIESARAVLGSIDLDPASSEEANRIVRAETYYTQRENGLSREWWGRAFLNPPYGGEQEAFTSKLLAEYNSGRVTEAILLVNAHCTDTSWFQPLWNHTLCFTDHRIDYRLPDGRIATSTSTHGSVFVYMGGSPDSFGREFSKYGAIVRRYTP